ncbi:hypothetical protein L207DRAFT_220076 [Hyaloscypha variabilis F]|uniref:Uncharacterized protein n=1 Tax=Hyaloscypha variabilis (strain UAMH 11265 / GT02V1 / F) TaxID=1149755 RepID=A0A2J6S7J8_HYAVF|nr:hypothetical protein L207DRAFT_220076 [Hyaloscypha variabilis F]
MSTEDTLANIATDKLILKLLQELVARVDRLEGKDQATRVQGHTARESSGSNSQDSSDIAIHQPNTTESGTGAAEAEDRGSVCSTCGKIPGDSCHCIEVPYGYLLEDEKPSGNMPTVEERVKELERSEDSRNHLNALKLLGIAAVPADGRLGFRNFWSRSATITFNLEQAAKCVHEISVTDGHFSVSDFDCHGNYVAYGPDEYDVTGRHERIEEDSTQKFRVPFIRVSPRVPYTAPWNRLM